MAADHVGKDVAGVDGDDDRRSKVNGEDLEQPRGDQDPAADHVGRGLAIGHFIREVYYFPQIKIKASDSVNYLTILELRLTGDDNHAKLI